MKRGRPKKSPRARLSLRVPKPLARELRRFSRELDRDQSDLVVQGLSELFERFYQKSEAENVYGESIRGGLGT